MTLDAQQSAAETVALKACINDLIGIVALPAIWSGGDARDVVGALLDLLPDTLHLDWVYVQLNDPGGGRPIEMARVAQSQSQTTSQDIREALRLSFGENPQNWPRQTQATIRDRDVSTVTLHLGVCGEVGVLVAGAPRTAFPLPTERLLLSIAANQAIIGLQEAQRLSEQKRIASELDRRVAQRTQELAAANQELRIEIAERGLIEERLRSEERRLKRSEALLAEAQRISSTGSFSWRVATDVVTYSEQTYRIHEFEPSAPVTLRMIATRIHPEDVPVLYEMIEVARGVGGDLDYEFRLQMPDTSVKHLHLVARATRDQDGQLDYIGAIQDITERRHSEEALDKARSELARVARITSLGALTASIAHEVNQPLSGIINNATTCMRLLAADPPCIEGAIETARRTIRDGNRAADVIARLRALFTKKDAAREPVDLNEATREVIALSCSELHRNRVILRVELADKVPQVTGDRVQLQQVILNLLLNASEAMSGVDDRPRHLLITTERHEVNGARLSVRDAGVGFDLQAQEKIFDAFYTTKHGGMGIGLSVSRSIIDRHHGRLWAVTNDGPGATFAFSIPSRLEDVSGAR
jgi:C4-dicarboxylate-specific signal transduction histidine kinase